MSDLLNLAARVPAHVYVLWVIYLIAGLGLWFSTSRQIRSPSGETGGASGQGAAIEASPSANIYQAGGDIHIGAAGPVRAAPPASTSPTRTSGVDWPGRFAPQGTLFAVTLDPAVITTPGGHQVTTLLNLEVNAICTQPLYLKAVLPAGFGCTGLLVIRKRQSIKRGWNSEGDENGFMAEILFPQLRPGDQLQFLVSGAQRLPSVPAILVGGT